MRQSEIRTNRWSKTGCLEDRIYNSGLDGCFSWECVSRRAGGAGWSSPRPRRCLRRMIYRRKNIKSPPEPQNSKDHHNQHGDDGRELGDLRTLIPLKQQPQSP